MAAQQATVDRPVFGEFRATKPEFEGVFPDPDGDEAKFLNDSFPENSAISCYGSY